MNINRIILLFIPIICYSCHSKQTLVDIEQLNYSMQPPVGIKGISQAAIKVELNSTSSTRDVSDDFYYAEYTNTSNNTVFIFSSYLHDLEIQDDILYQQDDSSMMVLRCLPFVNHLIQPSYPKFDFIILNDKNIIKRNVILYEFLELAPMCTLSFFISKNLFNRNCLYEAIDYKKAAESKDSIFHTITINDSSFPSSFNKYIELAIYEDINWCSRFFNSFYHNYFIEKSLSYKRIMLSLQ